MIPSSRTIRAFLVVMTLIPILLIGAGVGVAAALLFTPQPQYAIASIGLAAGTLILGAINYAAWRIRSRSFTARWWFEVTPRVWTLALNLSFLAGFIHLFTALRSIPD